MYKALRSMKVKGLDGQYRMVKPGEKVPEASGWRNLKSYILAGRIALDDDAAPVRARTVATKVPVKAAEKVPEKASEADQASEVSSDAPTPTVPDQAREVAEKMTRSSLGDMLVADLRMIAASRGLDATAKKSDLIKSILKDQNS